jgi:hypothetical protein
LLYEEFKAAVQQILAPQDHAAGGLVPIPAMRRALADRVTGEEFDVFLCALQRDGIVHLLTHVDADRLGDDDRKACLNHPSGVLAYWVCWV